MCKFVRNFFLHAKLQNGDMIAHDALYHKACLSNLYRTASNKQLGGYFSDGHRRLSGIAFGEVVAFIEETLLKSDSHLSKKLCYLLY